MSDNIPPIESGDLEQVQPGYLGPTPPRGQPPRRGERLWVDHPERLTHAVSILKQAHIVAIDAEFTQIRSRTQSETVSTIPRLALLQLAIGRHCFVVDTLRLNDLSPLVEVLEHPETIVLLHGAGADIRVMAERGLTVPHYYDLEATSRSIFGQHESSLAAMLQRAFNIRLDKSLQRTDWTRRPLPPAMIAYAARDAEVTLALYQWLDQYYHHILQLHDNTRLLEPVAAWIDPFLRGSSLYSPEIAVAEALKAGAIANKAQMVQDCRLALNALTHPIRRNRLLRLIADLSLMELAPDIIPLLQAPTSDERAGSVRALGRLSIKSAQAAIRQLLQDPVQDVRKATLIALRNLNEKGPRQPRTMPTKNADGSRTWTIAASNEPGTDDENGWKARLRAMMDQ